MDMRQKSDGSDICYKNTHFNKTGQGLEGGHGMESGSDRPDKAS